jgi:DNA-binding response OmpR family regulator
MHTILLVADRQNLIDRIHASLASADVLVIDYPDSDTAAVTAYEKNVDVVLVAMQVGTMGAMAVARDVRAKAGSADEIPVTILLDREADSFLAGRSGAKNWLLKSAPVSELQAAVAPEPTVAT